MDRKDRERIDSCCDTVVKHLNLVALWPKLLEHKVFNRDDVNIPGWTKSLSDSETIRDVYLTVKTRGPFAFQSLILSLRESGQESLADLLEGRNVELEFNRESRKQNKNDDKPRERIEAHTEEGNRDVNNTEETNGNETGAPGDSFFHFMQHSEEPLQIQVRKATAFLDGPVYKNVQRYPMRSKPRGLVLLITNIHYKYSTEPPRISAQHDQTNLTTLFEQMGFRVKCYQDLTGQELMDRIKEFSQSEEWRKVDSCFVIISSHGLINKETHLTEIQGTDYHTDENGPSFRTVLCSEVTDCFMADACRHLADKPKIFIFQMCRGKKKQSSIAGPRDSTDTSNFCVPLSPAADFDIAKLNKKTVRNYADMLIAHATMPGHVAFRDGVTGSWFIQILCEVFMNHACTTHIQDLLNMVDQRLNIMRTMKGECQTLTITSMGFNKHCYMHPGLFDGAA